MTDEALRALLQRFYALQGERVETYRLFEEGHRAYLSSAPHYDFPRYRQLVHEVTAAFSGISREVLQLQGRLRGELGRPDLAQHLTRLQEREQEKLQLTAQLQLARQRAQDEPSVDTHQQEVRELKHRSVSTPWSPPFGAGSPLHTLPFPPAGLEGAQMVPSKELLFGALRIVWRCRAAALPSASPG
uniref:Uncharacterized protein n=1 Tax=Gallus gallus TaxID=9031 RepID=A0A8V1AGG2_CHICK